MKKLFVISLMILIASCDSFVYERKSTIDLPEELSDCKFYWIRDLGQNGIGDMRIVRCPNSTTSVNYPVGKTSQTTVTVESDVEIDYSCPSYICVKN